MPHPRKDIINWQPGYYYHLYNRGARQLTIFREKTNYLFVLEQMKKYLLEFNLSIIAYCLMPNHYHFLVQQKGEYEAGFFRNGFSTAMPKLITIGMIIVALFLKVVTKPNTLIMTTICAICAVISTRIQLKMGWLNILSNGLIPTTWNGLG